VAREFDLLVLGGGPAGYPAAIRAAQLGARVCLVEREHIGGTCLNWGCIPTKTLHAVAHDLERVRGGGGRGLSGGPIAADAASLFANKARVVRELVSGVEKILKARKIEVLRGTGRLTGPGAVDVEGVGAVRASKIVLATGSVDVVPPQVPVDGAFIVGSKGLLDLGRIPESLVIVGGGFIGCEFASIFNALGSKVSIVEMLPSVLATEDAQISRTLQMLFRKKGIELHLGTKVVSAERGGAGIIAVLENGVDISAETVLVAVGRRPHYAESGIEHLGIEAGRGGIKVNESMETTAPGVYAAGDAVGGMLLAHVATRDGIVAAENALGASRRMSYEAIPSTIYTLPEISRVGITEEDAKRKGIAIVTGRFPFGANGKAKGLGEEDGFVKWIARADDKKLIGFHAIGPHVTELAASAALAIGRGLTAEELAECVFPHPTLSETLGGAAEAVYGKAIDLIR
jgi:dihydrolipoamide dehydrogenase